MAKKSIDHLEQQGNNEFNLEFLFVFGFTCCVILFEKKN